MENMTLFEKDGVWHFQGRTLTIGSLIVIDGVSWKVLGVGRSRREGRTPFIWIRNDFYGTSVHAPKDQADLPADRQALPFARNLSPVYGHFPKRKIAAAA